MTKKIKPSKFDKNAFRSYSKKESKAKRFRIKRKKR